MAASMQSMCQYWKNFDLQDLQKTLDTTATELANRQDESDASRKKLVEQSREFKKNTPEDLRKIVAPLLKSFQSEVDSLSKRSKAAEAAFLSVYKKIIDLPDPVSVLEHALQLQKKAQRVGDLEIENKQLRETLDEYNHEFAEVKNQEVTIKQLREKLKESEDKVDATVENRTREREKDLQRSFAEKERQLQETQLAVARKLGEAEQKVSTLHTSLENVQSELFEVKSKYDEATSAKSDEMEMVMSDLERANERASGAEREVEQLRQQLATATNNLQQTPDQKHKSADMEQAIDILQRSSLEVELAAKEKEIAQLVEDVQRLQASLSKLRESTASQVSRLEEELNVKNQMFKVLEEKIKTQVDYEEVKRELNVMKSIEFSHASSEESSSKSLEMLLMEKNKALQSENTTVKVAKNELSGNSTPALSENAEAFATMLGEEIAATYQNSNQSRLSTPSSTPVSNGVSGGHESEKLSPKRSSEKVSSIPSEDRQLPPPSPQIFPYPNGPFMANYMGLGVVKSDPNNSQGLDTALVAKTVRELLSIHNIGQRLFAKHVLGLSQGTVSELLSKPKSWDKLTEKGRESYRKMYSWATDDRNILGLKAISPKKSSQHLVPSVQREDSQTEERIAQILNEAQQAMHIKKAIEQHQVASAMANSIYQQEMTRLADHQALNVRSPPLSRPPSSNPHRHIRKHSTDSDQKEREALEQQLSSKDMVERIYRQELMKLAKAAESAGNIAASNMYQQELARLAAQSAIKDDEEPGEIRRSRNSPKNDRTIKTEPPDSTSEDICMQSNGPIDLSKHSSSAPTTPTSAGSDKSPTDSTPHSGSAFFLVRPKMNGHENGFENNRFPGPFGPSECISPLQRMQNIANSLMSRPHLGVSSNKPLRAVLPPITQEEFDKYSNISTEDLVKKVKETLSQYSISQRLFGENVLGLSQGSVSDLLARPKPWHMLTQKGREPFIRMQTFLEDAEAIPKLVASQYHIPPDKLMRNPPGRTPSEQAQRRRRSSSVDDRPYDSPSTPKRPRVFFNEEQKEKLRMAYNQDPYPNQSTIEGLANELGVGVKTVINWFHNHRMRAKQQQHAGNGQIPGSGSFTEYSGSMVKSEPTDDNSDQSDISSMSGDHFHSSGNFHGSEASSQWLFPQFERVRPSEKDTVYTSDRENNADAEDEEDDMDEGNMDCSLSPASSTKERLGDISGQGYKEGLENDGGKSGNEDDSDDYSQQAGSKSALHNVPQSGVNKRKRSNPQYVSEGRQLDKTKNNAYNTSLQSSVSRDEGVEVDEEENDLEKENEDVNNHGSMLKGHHVIDRSGKIQDKLQKAIESPDEDWGDDIDRSASIDKLQNSIQNSPSGAWEF